MLFSAKKAVTSASAELGESNTISGSSVSPMHRSQSLVLEGCEMLTSPTLLTVRFSSTSAVSSRSFLSPGGFPMVKMVNDFYGEVII